MRSAGVEFMLGGGFALAAYTGRWRDTKDIDLYIRFKDRRRAVDALTQAGFKDYFSRLPYDRKWIYRATRSGVIVDLIWSMANQRARVDSRWFESVGSMAVRNETVRILPLEHICWCKLYVLQRERTDWPDLFNLLCAQGLRLNWSRLLGLLNGDEPLLAGMLTIYGWLCPNAALKLPPSIWKRLGLAAPRRSRRGSTRNIRLLDSRPWFIGLLRQGEKLKV